MATGYTYGVSDGTVTEFSDFVWKCARAFGALVHMRDDPTEAKIPDEIQPSSYEAERVRRAQSELAEAEVLTHESALALQESSIASAIKRRDEYAEGKRETRIRYEAMLAKVLAWEPPTIDHEGMRNFMVEQLETSIEFDCSDYVPHVPERVTAEQWIAARVANAREELARAEKSLTEEIDRTNSRNAWLRALRESVPPRKP